MRLISTKYLQEGHIPAQNIYNSTGNVLIKKGVKLKKNYISLLTQKYGVSFIYIEDPRTEEIEIKQVVPDEFRFFAIGQIKTAFENLRFQRKFGMEKFLQLAQKIVKQYLEHILKSSFTDYNFLDIKPYDDYTSAHSINVMMLALIVGVSLNWSEVVLERMGLGAFLHDIGKAFIPLEVLDKPDKLTVEEFEIIKKHPIYGQQIFKDLVPRSSLSVIKSHHERLDGQGYPDGISNGEITDVAKLVAICDVYDALTSDRVYKKRVLPYFALSIIEGNSAKQFAPEFVECFKKIVVPYPKGTAVLLSNGYSGVVKKINIHERSRPVIKILADRSGNEVTPFFDIDLSEEKQISILKVLDDV